MGADKSWRWIFMMTVLIAGIIAGTAVGWIEADKRYYSAINAFPMLDPSVSNSGIHQELINFDPLRQDLKQYLAGLGLGHSLYFEYLPNGVSIRDGADTTSVAASLMKTPIVMDLYKLAEVHKLDLKSQVTVQPNEVNADLNYGDPTHLKAGDKITLAEAARITLAQSDNTTLNIIKDKLIPLVDNNTDSIQSLDVSYSLSGNTPGDEQVSISSRSYASILKCLYYACFNTPQDSTRMLNDLTGSADQNRLMAGVAGGIKVAHKVGSSPTSQSDCGIIYYPGRPYLVCLMFLNLTQDNVNSVDPYFQTVSQKIYDYISTAGKPGG